MTTPIRIPGLSSDADPTAAILEGLNIERQEFGLGALAHRDDVASCAAVRVTDMVNGRYFAHQDPDANPGKWWNVLQAAGLNPVRGSGENLALEYDLSRTVAAWMNSPAHRDNILDPNWDACGLSLAWGTGIYYGGPAVADGWVICCIFVGGLG